MPIEDEFYKRKLIERYLSGKATEHELEAFFGLLGTQNFDDLLAQYMDQDTAALQSEKYAQTRKLPVWRYIAAACALIVVSLGIFFLRSQIQPQQDKVVRKLKHDALPGRNQATLTLANGQKIVLTNGMSGKLAQQGNTSVQLQGDSISYLNGASSDHGGTTFNTLSTNCGEQSPYPLVLSDGSKIWLNAASSVTFPTSFTGKERKITVTGEAYIVVAHNPAHPFKVLAHDQVINDIGTEFNVNAYDDEASVSTTLTQGSIRIEKGRNFMNIKPGQQATTSAVDDKIMVRDCDVDAMVAWKSGLFHFEHLPLKAVMRQLSRWYDVKVIYEDDVPKTDITGEVYRNMNLAKVLEVLDNLKIAFRVEGKNIIVSNKASKHQPPTGKIQ
ncbi:FecR domain-containing protein [Mucilaginibacter sp. CSA2-8R]|uniref:FecR family protein n=1 Tax=Mucilaginibacter sp. CSA2-8R TaxID=3141542 RepID=UPI00315DE4F9